MEAVWLAFYCGLLLGGVAVAAVVYIATLVADRD